MAKSKPTVAGLKRLVEELLTLYPAFKRYERLKEEVKTQMNTLGWDQVVVPGGVVQLDHYERTEIPVRLAIKELGEVLADKIIQRKTFVSLELLNAFVKIGDISPETAAALKEAGDKTPVTSLKISLEGGAR